MQKHFIQALIESPLFRGVTGDELPALLDCLQPRVMSYHKGEHITTAGVNLKGIGVVLAGKAAALKESTDGNRVVMTVLNPGDLFGEIAAFAEMPRWPASVQAQDDTAVLFIPQDKIVGSCVENCPRHRLLISNMLRIVSERALMLNKKVSYLMIKSMRGRISAFLLDHYRKVGQATFTLPLNRSEMADFLNVSRPSMSREISRMKREGLIDYHLNSFRILDLGALQGSAAGWCE